MPITVNASSWAPTILQNNPPPSPVNPEWLFHGQFNFNLEALELTVTRGLSVPTREELSPYSIIVISAPNKLSLTDQFIDTALDLVADGRSMLLWVTEELPYYVNNLTERLGGNSSPWASHI